MNNRFLIGEMAKLHNTTIKTLRYYDEIGLLKPVQIDGRNGYRYYSTEQFEQLNTIQYLKELGFSLNEIKGHLEHRDIDGFMALLKKQKELTEKKIKELEQVNRKFENRMKDIQRAQTIKELGVVSIQTLKERKIVSLKEKISSEYQLEVSLKQLESLSNLSSSIFIGGVGLTISLNNIVHNKFNEYNSVFILVEEDNSQNPLVTTIPAGDYACIYYNGNHNDSLVYYQKLLHFMNENSFEIMGDSIERTIIDFYISKRKEDYLTEIQIPIKC